MLPPSTTGWAGSAASRAAISEDVVVLPLVPVTPMVGAGQRRRNRSASETRAGTVRSPPARASTSVRRAARRRGSVVGKSGVIDGDVATRSARRPGRCRVHVRTERQGHGPPAERRDRLGQGRSRPAVVDRDAGSGVRQEARQCEPAPGQAEDRDRPVAQGARPDRVEVEAVEVDRSARHRHHCNLSRDARKSVTPSSAARIPTIQKRTVIFSSSQPPSSKW